MLDYWTKLPNVIELFNEITVDFVYPEIKFLSLVTVIVVLIHGVLVLTIMSTFHAFHKRNVNLYRKQMDALVYFMVILLILFSHLLDIFVWTYAMVSVNVFPSALKTFYFAGEMYTNLDHNDPIYILGPQWNMLPILLSFSGLFAVALSGSALYGLLMSTFSKPVQK